MKIHFSKGVADSTYFGDQTIFNIGLDWVPAYYNPGDSLQPPEGGPAVMTFYCNIWRAFLSFSVTWNEPPI